MVNENTRMYIPEENHQGKAGPRRRARRPRPRAPRPRPVPAARPSPSAAGGPRDPGRTARSPSGKSPPLPRPRPRPPSRASGEFRARGKVPKCLLRPRWLALAGRARLPGRRRPSPVGRGPRLARARLGVRARSPHQAGRRPRPGSALQGGGFESWRPSLPLSLSLSLWTAAPPHLSLSLSLSLCPSSPAHLHPPTSLRPLTPARLRPVCSYSHPHVG